MAETGGQSFLANAGGAGKAALPRVWLFTDDQRLPDPCPVVRRLPPGAGVVLRHYRWPPPERLRLGRALAILCRQRRILLLVAEDAGLARAIGAAGLHLPSRAAHRLAGARLRHPDWFVTCAAHDGADIAKAGRGGADAVFISPVFATASHPGARVLGPVRFAALADIAHRAGLRVFALGGMSAARLRRLHGADGFGAIGALSAP